jgi:DNA mismatch endonuclease (patch repair protein)
MQRNTSRWTSPEIRLVDSCLERGLCLYFDEALTGRPDFLAVAANVRPLAVFMHGCFWHGCPRHFKSPKTNLVFWEEKIRRNRRRHQRVQRLLREDGWRSITIWEHEVYENLDGAVARIARRLEEPR